MEIEERETYNLYHPLSHLGHMSINSLYSDYSLFTSVRLGRRKRRIIFFQAALQQCENFLQNLRHRGRIPGGEERAPAPALLPSKPR